jgi:hypothetical protein
VHTNPSLQSLFITHVPPTSILLGRLQPAASHAETIIKPRRRSHDADISNLQVSGWQTATVSQRDGHEGFARSVLNMALSFVGGRAVQQQTPCHRRQARDTAKIEQDRAAEVAKNCTSCANANRTVAQIVQNPRRAGRPQVGATSA